MAPWPTPSSPPNPAGFFGLDHALAQLEQHVPWRAVWGVFIYGALVLGSGSVLYAPRAQASALAAAQADAARVRAELAAISGKLNPHFFFNTLNSLVALTRQDAGAAEQALMRFARMMRCVLDSQPAREEAARLRGAGGPDAAGCPGRGDHASGDAGRPRLMPGRRAGARRLRARAAGGEPARRRAGALTGAAPAAG